MISRVRVGTFYIIFYTIIMSVANLWWASCVAEKQNAKILKKQKTNNRLNILKIIFFGFFLFSKLDFTLKKNRDTDLLKAMLHSLFF